jgi:hypothetical protein
MYIHIGEDLTVKLKDIVAIVDKQSGQSSLLTEAFIKRHEGNVNHFTKQSFKSIVITNERVYFSPYSSGTLKKRSNFMNIQE